MPLPAIIAAPTVLKVVSLGGAFVAGAALAARRGPERVDIRTEDTLDTIPEGGDLRLDGENRRVDAETRFTRTVRLGPNGPGFTLDVAALGRIRVKREAPRR